MQSYYLFFPSFRTLALSLQSSLYLALSSNVSLTYECVPFHFAAATLNDIGVVHLQAIRSEDSNVSSNGLP